MKDQLAHCRNCGIPLQGLFCHACGQRREVDRWTTPILLGQFLSQLTNIEKGFLHTVKFLFIKPGQLIMDFWEGKTVNYYNPFRYVLIWTAINLVVNFWLGIDDMLQDFLQPALVEEQLSAVEIQEVDSRFDSWLNILVLLLIPFNSLMTKWLFKSGLRNYGEHLILNSYVLGQQALITSFTHFIFYLFPPLFVIYLPFNLLIGLVYNSFVFKQTFGEKWGITFVKALVLGLTGLLVFFGLVALFSAIAVMIL